MKKTVLKLALDDVFRNRKRSCLQVMIISLSAALFFFVSLLLPHCMSLYRQYCSKYYGDWYAYADIPDEGIDLYRHELDREDRYGGLKDFGMKQEGVTEQTEADRLRLGYLYRQGSIDGYAIGHADESLYDLCRLDLVSGSYPQEDEVMITQEVSSEYSCGIGSGLLLEVNGRRSMYTVSGIVHKSQDLFPDIYTSIEEGDAYVFFDRHFGQYAQKGRFIISHFGFALDYIENEYGYDHFTRNNDTWAWDNSHDSFKDYTMAQLLCALTVILILYFMNASVMKRRIRELSLLRGIGMTGSQIILMVMISVTLISLCAALLGGIMAFLFGSAADLYADRVHQIHDGSTYLLFLQEPLKICGCGLLVILFALLGAYVPVLRSAQNVLSGSFESGAAHRKKHRQVLKAMHVQRLAGYELFRTKGICAGALLSAVLIGALILPGGAETAETYRTAEGAETILYSSAHAIEMYTDQPSDDAYISGLPLEKKVFRLRVCDDPVVSVSEPAYTIWADGRIAAADEQFAQNAQIDGRLPETDDEALLMYEYSELGYTEEYNNGTAFFSAGKRLQKGDRIRCGGREYTVTGIVMPDETVRWKGPYPGGPDNGMELSLYRGPYFSIAVTPHVFEQLRTKELFCEKLVYADAADTLPLLNELYLRGMDLDDVYLSDVLMLHCEYRPGGMNLHLSRGMLAVPVLFGLLIFSLLQMSFMHASQDELILYRALGMTRKQAVQKELCKALYMTCAAAVLYLLYCIYLFAALGTWRLDIGTMILFMTFSLLCFTLMYTLPLKAMLAKDYEDLRRE
ncbi:MAG: ABC transporter permease [Solobacterium sp.]|nr:ABC transporter permease [Solobacterium sp.]